MRLLILSQYFWPENFRINDLVSELARRGHEITVLTGKPNYPDVRFFPEFLAHPEKFCTYEGTRIVRVPIVSRGSGKLKLMLNYASFALSATLFGILLLRRERFDVMFVFEPSPVTVGLPAIAFRRLKRLPLAFWVLDQWPETLDAVGVVKSKTALRLIGTLVSLIYTRCDLILAQSKGLVTQIGKYCRNQGQIAYFPNWVESDYRTDVSLAAAEVPIRNGSFNVLYAGNIGEAQDFPSILDAAEALADHSNIRWLVVGDGRVAGWVKQEVIRRGLQEHVILLGRYSADRMLSFFQHADALLVTLKSDPIFSMTIPGKVQSYLAAGIPILAMLDGEGARVIQDANAGFVCPAGDSRALADAVVRMAGLTSTERQAMGERGRAYSRLEFDRDALFDKLEVWLLELSRSVTAKKGAT